MGDATWIDRQETGLGSKGQKESPNFAPFYLGVRNDLESEANRKILKTMAVPSFADKRNLDFMKDNSEFWFSAPGAGAKVHMDSHCVSTLSINLSGASY